MNKWIKSLLLIALLTLIELSVYGQTNILIDGDEIILRDSLDKKFILLTTIKRKAQDPNTLWIKYDRRPGVDPWIRKPVDGLDKYSDENFIRYLKERGIHVIGAITTHDPCLCAKHKTISSPDMYLIYFKIKLEQWNKLKEFYPEMINYSSVVN